MKSVELYCFDGAVTCIGGKQTKRERERYKLSESTRRLLFEPRFVCVNIQLCSICFFYFYAKERRDMTVEQVHAIVIAFSKLLTCCNWM